MQPGGQLTITTDVENYPGFPKGILGPELMELFREQAKRFGTQINADTVARVDLSTRPFHVVSEGRELLADSLIICHRRHRQVAGPPLGEGALRPRRLGLRDLRRLLLPRQAHPRGRRRRHRDGRGQLPDQDCSKVTVVHRRDTFRASAVMLKRAQHNHKIAWEWNQEVVEVLGNKEGHVRGVRTKNLVTGAEKELDAQGLFVAIGHQPNTELFKGQLDMDEVGYIKVEAGSTRTHVPGYSRRATRPTRPIDRR